MKKALLAGLLVASGCASSASLVRADLPRDVSATVARSDVEGEWSGVFHQYPHLYKLTLVVDANGQGTLSAQRLKSESVAVRAVRVDLEPFARTVDIRVGEAISQGGRVATPIAVPDMAGYYTPSMSAIGGCVASRRRDSSPHFVLGKGKVGAEFVSVASSAHNSDSAALGALFHRPSVDSIEQWAATFEREYPQLDPRRTEFSRLYAAARPLFGDDVMLRYFGNTYDGLGHNGRNGIVQSYRSNRQELRQYDGLIRGFQDSGTYTDDDITVSVLATRVIVAWAEASTSRLAQCPETEEAFRSLDLLETAYSSASSNVLPSKRGQLDEEMSATRARIARTILNAKAESLRTSGGLVVAQAIVHWNADNVQYCVHMSEGDCRRLRSSLQPTLTTILSEETAAWKPRLLAAPISTAGLAQTVHTYRQYASEFGFAWDHQEVRDGLRPLVSHREQIVNAVFPTLQSEVQQATTQADLSEIYARYLAAPGDPEGKAASLIASRLRELEQQDAIERAAILFVLALGAEALGDHAVKDAELGDALLAGGITVIGRNWLIREAAKEVVAATDADESDRQTIEDMLLLSTRLITGTSTEAEVVAALQAASARVAEKSSEKLATDISLFATEVGLKWRDNNQER